MSIRPVLHIGLFALAAVAIANPEMARAADESPVYTGLVPDDAFAAVVLHPKRLLTSEGMAKFDVKGLTASASGGVGGSVVDIEQIAIFMGPMEAIAEVGPRAAATVRFSEHHVRADWGTKFGAKYFAPRSVEEIEICGHKCYRARKSTEAKNSFGDIDDPNLPVLCVLDDRTYIMASESWLPKILGAKNAKSELISALATLDPAADLEFRFVGTDAAQDVLAKSDLAKAFPGPLKPIGEIPGLLHAASLTVRTRPAISLKLTLIGKDEASADKIDQTIKSVQQLGEAFLPALQVPLNEKLPAEQRASREFCAALAGKLIDGLVPHLSGKQVAVEIGGLGTVDAVFGKVLLPAIVSARKAAQRMVSVNNLRQLSVAMLASQQKDNHFPAHAIYSKGGKPLLSWRVYLLPYLGQEALFKQFHLDEPWDSPNNKPLIAKMPMVFDTPAEKPLAEGQTRDVVPFGKNTIFDGDKGIPLESVTDGLSNTILLLEVGEDKAVTWTKPDDMNFDPKQPLAGWGKIDEAGLPVAFADGSVQTIRKGIDVETFRRLILRNDGLPVDPSKL